MDFCFKENSERSIITVYVEFSNIIDQIICKIEWVISRTIYFRFFYLLWYYGFLGIPFFEIIVIDGNFILYLFLGFSQFIDSLLGLVSFYWGWLIFWLQLVLLISAHTTTYHTRVVSHPTIWYLIVVFDFSSYMRLKRVCKWFSLRKKVKTWLFKFHL